MISNCDRFVCYICAVLLLCLLSPLPAASQDIQRCPLSGVSVAELSEDPALGKWKYTVDVIWDTGTQHGLSHLDVLLGLKDCPCACDIPGSTLDQAGFSTGEGGCTVYYYGEFECSDPSIPNLKEAMVKFEPVEDECEPGRVGVGTFVFYSDWPPVTPVGMPKLLAIKASGDVCLGDLSGVLPDCRCSSPAEFKTWGVVKVLFR